MEPTFKKGDKIYLIRRNIKIKRLSDKLNHKKIRLYKIKKIKGLINYELALLSNINIYFVFYIFLFELVLAGALRALKVEIELVNLNAEYDIEEILDY